MKHIAASLVLAALLLPATAHAQAVGGFQRRSTGPAPAPVSAPPPQTNAPVYNAPVYSSAPSNAPVSNAPVYQAFPPVQSVRPQPAPSFQPVMPGFQRSGPNFQRSAPVQTYSNAPVYNYRTTNAPVYSNAPTYNSNAPVYGGNAGRRVRVTTPNGPTYVSPPGYSHSYSPFPTYSNSPVYAPAPVYNNGGYNYGNVTLLGGYYYGNYCDTYVSGAYPSLYGYYYNGLPTYVVGPGVSVSIVPNPIYVTGYLPFYAPTYPVTYNENNYYVGSETRVREVQSGGETARQAVRSAVPANSYQAAFGDIEQAWSTGNVGLLRKHVRDEDTKVSVYLKNKYAYSLASGDLVQITRDAFDRLDTVSFRFDHLRKAKNGDVTAYGAHVYRVRDGSDTAAPGGDAVPFTTDGGVADSDVPAASGTDKTVYVSYTLRHGTGQWYIVGVNSSPNPVPGK